MNIGNEDYLAHYGVKGQKWGVRRYQNEDGSLTEEGKRRYENSVFISGTTKTHEEGSYKRDSLPKKITDKIDEYRNSGRKILVGDAPGIDSQVQDYLAKNNYNNVEVFVSGDEVRKMAGEKLGWKVNNIDGENFEKYSKEWRAVKDKAMNAVASEGLAVVIKDGSGATRKNIDRFIQNGKAVMVYQLDDEDFVDPILNQKEYEKMKHDDLIEKGSDFLSHHGIKGQSWGVRRFQNEDGTLTPEGRKRYGLNPKYAGMTDKELREALETKRTQNKYVELMTEGPRKKQNEIRELTKTAFSTAKTGVGIIDATKWQSIRNQADAAIKENQDEIDRIQDAAKEAKDDAPNKAAKRKIQAEADELKKPNEENIKMYKNTKEGLDAGKKFLDKALSSSEYPSKLIAKTATDKELKEKTAEAKRNIQEMDHDELKKTVDRILLEKQYDELVNPPPPSKVERGREILQTVGSVLGVALTTITIAKMFKDWKGKDAAHSEEDGEYLAHYRTKGSKNGVRRYQNEDGSLTPEGYRHYGIDPNGRQAADPREMLARQRAQQQMQARETKTQRRQAGYTQKFQQRQALREARNQAKIQNVYDRQALRAQREQANEQNRAAAENRANLRRNIVKGVAAVAVIGAALYTGRHFLQQRALDNQYARDVGKMNIENKAKLEQIKAQLEPIKYEKETARKMGMKQLDIDKYKAVTEREKGHTEKYKAVTDREKGRVEKFRAETSRMESKALKENEGLNKTIKSLSEEKNSLTKDKNALEKQAKSLTEEITNKENQRKVLENKVTEVKTEKTRIENELKKIEEDRAIRRERYKKGQETKKKNLEEKKKMIEQGNVFLEGWFKGNISKSKKGG